MDGAEAARTLAEDARTARIPVVALTSLRLDDESDRLRTAGFAGYLEKPINVADFPDQVRRYCRECRASTPRTGMPAGLARVALPPTVLN